jgi:DNA-binding beta-propeller fold protein YncE
MARSFRVHTLSLAVLAVTLVGLLADASDRPRDRQRYLYVASPGVRDNLNWGGHGVLVFEIDSRHHFKKRIPLDGYGEDENGKALNVKGICANAKTGRLYVSTLQQLVCIDLVTDKVIWQKSFGHGSDRMSITPDGEVIYLPSLEKQLWYIVDAKTGKVLKRLELNSRSHNTIVGLDGRRAYLAGLASPYLAVVSTANQTVELEVGPFANFIRPFTINGAQTRVFANVNGLLGFEIGDLEAGRVIGRVEIKGFPMGPPKRHGCPSHGIALSPDEREIWVCDSFNSRLHVFDATASPPEQGPSIPLREQPGWVTFSIDGRYAYPSTGEVIDAKTKKIVGTLSDEKGRPVHSEKMMEIDFANDRPLEAGNQFGLGRVTR